MSGPSHARETPIHDHRLLAATLEGGCKPVSEWRIGTEHEKFGFYLPDRAGDPALALRPPPYEGEHGIGALLEGIAALGWNRIEEHGRLIALSRDGASVTLEPAGQLELSGAPLETIHQTCCETTRHLSEVREVADPLGIGFLGMGFQPKWARGDMPWMPKGRYRIMREYMPRVGKLGLDMMTRTCTVQVNLDFSSEADMVKKFRTSLALQPVATALFADSPFTEGKPNGFLSYRSHIWTDTDKDRTGMLDFVFEDGFGFERYVDYLLDVPMYFVHRDGEYLDAAWALVRDFTRAERHALRDGVPRHGLRLPFRGASVRELALAALEISRAGLARRARLNGKGEDEGHFLDPLFEIAHSNQTPAERKLDLFRGVWGGSVDPIFTQFAY